MFDLSPLRVAHRQDIAPENLDLAFGRPVEPDDRPQQDRFPGTGSADDADNFTSPNIEVETVVHRFGAKPVDEPAHPDDRFLRVIRRTHIARKEKTIEKAASATMTKKIASTTERVVCRPTLSALRPT